MGSAFQRTTGLGDVDISGIWYVVLAAKGCTYAYMIQYYVVRLIPSYHIPPNSQGMKRVRKRYRGRAYLERLDPFCPARSIFSHRAFFFFASALAPPLTFDFSPFAPPLSQLRASLHIKGRGCPNHTTHPLRLRSPFFPSQLILNFVSIPTAKASRPP